MRKLACLFTFIAGSLGAMEKLPDSYVVRFGLAESPNTVVEYISVGCPTCHRLFKEDYQDVVEKILIPKKASWIFHLVPDDLLSCQLALCLNALEGKELDKRNLFGEVMRRCGPDYASNVRIAQKLMKQALQEHGIDTKFIDDLETLKGDKRIKTIFAYLSQEDAIRDVPTVEINGKVYEEIPSYRFVKGRLP